MRSLKYTLLAAALVGINSFAFAQLTKQDRHLTGFNAVSVSGSFDVYITQGSTEAVKVEASADVIDRIITEVDGGTLKIYTKNNTEWHWTNNKKTVIYVAIKDVNGITLSGSGDVYFKDGVRASSLKLKLTGSGDLTGKLDVKTLDSSIAGSGDITISGKADNSSVSVVGSGDFTAQNLVTDNTSVRVSGSGDAKVNVSGKLDASVVGSGDIQYTGSVKSINTSKSGSGSVSRL